ncbi:MAG: hypothetical protein WD928_11895 [Gammaproteobacteria bacterium]
MSPAPGAGRLLRERLAGWLICTMIVLSVINGVSDGAFPAWPAGLLAWLIGVMLIETVPRFQQIQFVLMAGIGLAALGLAGLEAAASGGLALLEGNQALLGMLAAVSFLRMVTRTGTHLGERLPQGRQALYQTLAATHLFGAVINISAAFIVGQRIAKDGSLTALQAKVISRAFTAAACWSPLFAAMAVVLHYVPGVDMLAVGRVNLVLALLLLGYCALELGRDPAVADFVGFPLHREALTVPVLLSVLVIAFYNLPTTWPILTTIVIAAASCVVLMNLRRPPRDTRRLFSHHVERELPRMGGEFALFLGAAVLGAGVGALAGASDLDLVIDPRQPLDGVPLLIALVGLTLVGIHPVISVAAIAGLFPASLAAPNLVGMVVLMAWSVALGTSPFSGTALAMQGRFGIPATNFLRWNFRYLLVGLLLATLVLAGADYFT